MNFVDVLRGLRSALAEPNELLRDEVFVREVMEPLRPMWATTMARMGRTPEPMDAARLFHFYRPELGADRGLDALDVLGDRGAWPACLGAYEQALKVLNPEAHGVTLPGENFAFVLADPNGLDPKLGGYTGAGNVPGWAVLLAWPTEFNLPRLSAIVAHELHHNVRFAFEPGWPMPLGQYLVVEGLAEAFAASLHGEDKLGPWTTGMREEEVEAQRPRFAAALLERDFGVVRGFIFGDASRDIPDFAGYALGYRMVLAALENANWSPVEATYRPWHEVVAASRWFDEVLSAGVQ